MVRTAVYIFLSLAAAATAFDDEPKTEIEVPRPMADEPTFRLPNDTRPLHYDITLQTWIDQGVFDFAGNVRIHLRVEEAHTNTITIHSYRQNILRTELRRLDGLVVPTWPHQYDAYLKFLTVQVRSGFLLQNEEFILEIDFTGELRNDAFGFYRSSYVTENGDTRWLAATQFRTFHGRSAFPCYDEPGFRAIFGLTIVHGSGYRAVSNMPVKTLTVGTNGMTTTTFEYSPSMQSNLNAFVVSDLEFITNANTKRPDELLQSVYGQPANIARGEADFALEAGEKILQALETYLQFNYSLPKMDQFALPVSAEEAVENWGLVTYREQNLYFDPETMPMSQMNQVASLIAQKFAQQFFGNAVSPQWWTYLWLSEGFATLFAHNAVDLVYPSLRSLEMMQVSVCQTVMRNDASEDARAMNFYAESFVGVNSLFDFVASSKSGCVIRMLQHIVTDATFARGLSAYLQRMENQSVTPDDLYASLTEVVREEGALPAYISIKEVMDSWTNQGGFPMLTVERSPTGQVTVTQERFLLQASSSAQPQTWWIPYNIASKSSPNFERTAPGGWIPQGFRIVSVRPSGAVSWNNDDWLIFNKQGTGYYRVNYDDGLWAAIIDELVEGDFNLINRSNRAQLIDDAYNMALIMRTGFNTVFGLMEYLTQEQDYLPWAPAARILFSVHRKLGSLDIYDHFRMFVRNTVAPIFNRIGVRNIQDESYFDRRVRNVAVFWACYAGVTECQVATTDRIREYVTSDVQFEPDNKYTVMCAGFRAADTNTGIEFWEKIQASPSEATRNISIDVMGCSQNVDLLQQLLATLIVTDGVTYIDAERTRLISSIAFHSIQGTMAVMQFMEENALIINDMVPLGETINNMASWLANQADFDRFNVLLDQLVELGTITANQRSDAQSAVRDNIRWIADYGGSIVDFLNDYVQRQ